MDTHRDSTLGDEARQLRDSWTAHLAQFSWDHFVTLTTACVTTPERLVREFRDVFVRNLARAAQGPIAWFYAVERHASGAPHVHALLSGTARLSAREVERRWKLGLVQAHPFDPALGGAAYIVKSIAENPETYDFSRRRPPRRPPPQRDSGRMAA